MYSSTETIHVPPILIFLSETNQIIGEGKVQRRKEGERERAKEEQRE
jgi:hypothetical protein